MAPVFAWGASKLVGARAGLVAGACLLVQPALTAWSLRIEPSALFMVLLGLLLGALGEALHQGSRRAAVGAGLTLAALGLCKESGVYLALPALLGLALCERAAEERRALTGLCAAAFLSITLPFQAWDRASPHGVAEKTALPMLDREAFLERGEVPKPLLARDDPALTVSQEVQRHLSDPNTSRGERARWLWQEQARRAWRFLGPWLLVAPLGALGVVALAPRGALDRGSTALILGLHAMLIPVAWVVVQGRHAEVGLVGTWLALGLGVDRGLNSGLRRGLAVAVAALLSTAGGIRAFTLERSRLEHMQGVAETYTSAAKVIQEALPEGAVLCSNQAWVGWFTRSLAAECLEAPPPERPLLYAVAKAEAGRWPEARPRATFEGAWQVNDACVVLVLLPPEDRGRPGVKPDLSRVGRCRVLPGVEP